MDARSKALIVDADVARGGAVATALRAHGWEPVLARDASFAFSLALRLRPSVVILRDHVAAGGTPAALARLRNSVHTAAAHVVVVGCDDPQRVRDVLAAGAQECVPGDVSPQTLCNAAERARAQPAPVVQQAPAETIAEPGRLQAVERMRDPAAARKEALQELTELAASLLGTRGALLTLVSADRQTFLSRVGQGGAREYERETPLSHSFCQWVVSDRAPVLVDDAREHPVLQSNKAIEALGVVAYAGVPISAGDEHTVGSFCTTDPSPRAWVAEDLLVLKALGKMVEAALVGSVPNPAQPGRTFVVIGHGISAAGSLLRRVRERRPEAQDVVLRFIERQSRELMVQAIGFGTQAIART